MSNSLISNRAKYEKLSPEDIQFYEQVNSRITASNALPFEVPVDAFFRTTIACMKWFWEWYEGATQEQMLYLDYGDIMAIPKDGSGNINILLPEGIQGIIEWKQSSATVSRQVRDYLRIALLQTYSSNYVATPGSGAGHRDTYGFQNPSLSNAVIAIYEAEQYRETFTRGVRANFNKNTGIFRIMSNVQTGLVLQCMVRLHPEYLYGDIMFENYVVACIEEQLGRIVTAFDFKLPGSVTINYDQITEYGKDKRKEIEEEIKASNNTDFITWK